MRITGKVTGLQQLKKNISIQGKRIDAAIAGAVKEVSFDLLGKAVNLAPIDTGDLRGSGSVEIKETDHSVDSEIGFATPYAIKQHEDLTLNHPQGGQAKYLEEPFKKNKARYEKYIGTSIRDVTRK